MTSPDLHIEDVSIDRRVIPLRTPYAIARASYSSVELFVVTLRCRGGFEGLGSASPDAEVTGETIEACAQALEAGRSALAGRNAAALGARLRELAEVTRGAPAARAALDMALHDLVARSLGVPLVDLLGRVHHELPTSVTIGILPLDETLARARELVGAGFRVLKLKTGHAPEADLECARRLRAAVPAGVRIRIDANAGYGPASLKEWIDGARGLDLEFLEQPLPRGHDQPLCALPEAVRARLAADESLIDERDALGLLEPPHRYGIFNIKLMKCGGIAPARTMAAMAETAGVGIMWGCMDESCISIAAALHVAFASPATRYLDLDGSLDLVHDPAAGGFVLEDGMLRVLDRPGIGAVLR